MKMVSFNLQSQYYQYRPNPQRSFDAELFADTVFKITKQSGDEVKEILSSAFALDEFFISPPDLQEKALDILHLDQMSFCPKLLYSIFLPVVVSEEKVELVRDFKKLIRKSREDYKLNDNQHLVLPDVQMVNLLARQTILNFQSKYDYYDPTAITEEFTRILDAAEQWHYLPDLSVMRTEQEVYDVQLFQQQKYLKFLFVTHESPFKNVEVQIYKIRLPHVVNIMSSEDRITIVVPVIERKFGNATMLEYFKVFSSHFGNWRASVYMSYDVQLLYYLVQKQKGYVFSYLQLAVNDLYLPDRIVFSTRKYYEQDRKAQVQMFKYLNILPVEAIFDGFLTEKMPLMTDKCAFCQLNHLCFAGISKNIEAVMLNDQEGEFAPKR